MVQPETKRRGRPRKIDTKEESLPKQENETKSVKPKKKILIIKN